jgi:hypothetical protein
MSAAPRYTETLRPPTTGDEEVPDNYTGIGLTSDDGGRFGVWVDGDLITVTDRIGKADEFLTALGVQREHTIAEEMEAHA